MYCIRQVTPHDLQAVTALENQCFPPAEAASLSSFYYRIATFPKSFYVAEEKNTLIGLINGCISDQEYISDKLFEPQGGHNPHGCNQMIFGLATRPDHQRQGVGTSLMNHLIESSRKSGCRHMVLTCKKNYLPYYEKFGYINKGQSTSIHGGAIWYDMVLVL